MLSWKCLEIIQYMDKKDLVLNDLWLIYHKTKQNKFFVFNLKKNDLSI